MVVHPQVVRHWLMVGASVCAGASTIALGGIAYVMSRRPTAKQLEERRRRRLAAHGRIVDGSLIDAQPADSAPQTILYTYRIAGVTYECAQDVSALEPLIENLRLDYPVQVRYNRDNPADSIVVAETWNGLRTHQWSLSSSRVSGLRSSVTRRSEDRTSGSHTIAMAEHK